MFAEEAEELFDTADEILLEAESSGDLDDDNMASLFRAMHTLKGSGSSVELQLFTEFAHETENFMDQLRNKKIAYQADMAGLLIDCTDTLRELLSLEMEENLDRDTFENMSSKLIADIKAYTEGGGAPAPAPEAPAAVEAQPEPQERAEGYGENYGFFDENLDAQAQGSATPPATPSAPAVDDGSPAYGFFDHVEHNASAPAPTPAPEAPAAPQPEQSAPAAAAPQPNPTPAPVAPTPAPAAKAAPKKEPSGGADDKKKSTSTATIRVNLDKIDVLMNNVGELVITNAMLAQFASSLNDDKVSDAISEKLELLNRHIRELQESIMSIRMVPMENIYSKFPKVVRDVAKKFNKKIDFKHFGDNVEIDKAMIEGLTDPLMHIIRNSLDHGIEMPQDRLAVGKPENGTVTIGAEQSNGQMIITITDDGKGIDVDKVVEKSIEKGTLTPEKAEVMSDEEKALLIFGAGLSTAEKITDISGRGVGMDVVKTNITKLGGVIKIDTEKGFGTTITIILPLTLAILDGLDVAVGDKRYILPLNTIVESLQPKDSMIKRIGNGNEELLMLREEFIPVVRLYQLFGETPEHDKLDEGMLIVVKSGDFKVALFVDEFLNQHQVVVKPLDKNFRNVDGVGAATVRGDGSIGLILDVMGIIEEQKRHERKVS
jgi:two-component system chemotaxis sensor kinase CheA